MRKAELDSLLGRIDSWNLPENAEAKTAFVHQMRSRQYGFAAAIDAWHWFLNGWSAREPRRNAA